MTGLGGAAEQAVRAFAFAEPRPGHWGAAWLPGGAPPAGVFGLGERGGPEPFEFEGAGPDTVWRLRTARGSELTLEGLGEPVGSQPGAPPGGFDQMCRVAGTIDTGQGTRNLECLGCRGERAAMGDPSIRTFRLAAGWFEDHDGFVLLAGRPQKARGQDEDVVGAALFDPAGPRVVAEPRLSTTYDESGQPTRAGVELWIEADADPDHVYPRRAIGQAMAAPARWSVADLTLEVQPFQWFSGDRRGAGVYLLGQW